MKLRSKFLSALICIAALVILLIAAVHAPPVRHYVLKRLGAFLKSSQGIDMTAGALHYNLLMKNRVPPAYRVCRFHF